MADSEVLKGLRDIPIRIQTASIPGRRKLVNEIQAILSTPGITEPVIKFVCRVLALTLHRYRDSTSQSHVKRLLTYLSINHRVWTLNNLPPVLVEISEQLKNTTTSKNVCQSGLFALRWSTILVENGLKVPVDNDTHNITVLITAQTNLLAAVSAFGDQKQNDRAYDIVHRAWNTCSLAGRFLEQLVSGTEPNPAAVVALSVLCRHFSDNGQVELCLQHKTKMLELFTKSLISVKSRPNSNYIKACKHLLALLQKEELQETLLPALHKAMLRSPEIIIDAVGVVFATLSLDLNDLTLDIGKSLIGNLHSKDDTVRSSACAALQQVARRIHTVSAGRALLNHLFSEYHGAGGKLTSSEYKISILQAAGELSDSLQVREGRVEVAEEARVQLSRVLDTDTHERTLCVALHALAAWSEPAGSTDLIVLFKKNLSLKSSTPLVRIAYMQFLGEVVRHSAVSQQEADSLWPVLIKSVEKAVQQPLQQNVVCEAISAAYVLTLVSPVGSLSGGGRGAILWSALQHRDKHVLLHDRVLLAATDDGIPQLQTLCTLVLRTGLPPVMFHINNWQKEDDFSSAGNPEAGDTVSGAIKHLKVVLLCRQVLEDYSIVANDGSSPVYRAFVLALLSPSKAVRSVALRNVKQLLSDSSRGHVARTLVWSLNDVLDDGKTLFVKEKSPSDEKCSDLTGKIILDTVNALCSNRDYPKDVVSSLLLEVLPSCHHPLAVATNKNAWLSVVKYMKLEPNTLVQLHLDTLINTYISQFKPNETVSNVVCTLSRASPELVRAAVSCVLDAVTDPELGRVTRDQYFTYLTPDGDLYDKTAVPGNEDTKEMNMKRESKAYSYKDQLEELQLRRELDEKKRKEGKIKEVPLTAKQKDAIKSQLAKESVIRQRLTVLNNRVSCAVGLCCAVARGNISTLGCSARRLFVPLLPALRSPLAAPHLVPLYLHLSAALAPSKHLALSHLVARTTLRLYKPQCDLDPSWEEEELLAATSRTVSLLHEATVKPKQKQQDEELSEDEEAAPGKQVTTPQKATTVQQEAAPDDPDTREDTDATPGKQDTTLEDLEEIQPVKYYFSAPAFCYLFPLLQKGVPTLHALGDDGAVLKGVQVIAHHGALRATSPLSPEHPKYLPIDHIFRMLMELVSMTSGRVQSACTAALLEVAQASSGEPDCHTATWEEVQCLLDGLQSPLAVVRDAALCALQHVRATLPLLLRDHALPLCRRLVVAKFDVEPENREQACNLWDSVVPDELQESVRDALTEAMLQEVKHPADAVQRAAAAALAHLLDGRGPDAAATAAAALLALYREKLPLIPAKLDQFGHVVEEAVDEWDGRRGCAVALAALAPHLDAAGVATAVKFFVHEGLADRAEAVRVDMLTAAMTMVELHGKETISSQLPVFEQFLDTAPKSGSYDAVRQCVVLLVGSLARHLGPDDARIRPIALRLVAALNTPSQQVQEAVSNCLPHLVTSQALKEDVPVIVNKLMKQLLTAEKYGDRKGAAYGIAGIVKGLGILTLKQLDIMSKLTDAIQEKKNYKYREGALFAFEMLCQKLGRLFEPYVVHVLPHLLLCFGDGSQYVRAAADDAAKLIMSKLSAHGVKLVLPSLLQALEDDNWRTKTGSVELLGAMAYCAPKQLSSCLPSIVPKLIEVLSDSHMRVQAAGAEALKVIGSVIRNPEIQAIVPVLLEALQDPSEKTPDCLQTLLDTKFVHFIDAPSLALIMPVVERAFQDRGTDVRKMASQIIGNMYSLTDQKDLQPYLDSIIPGLKGCLLDPVPEVRSVSSRALGAMVRGMGEASFEDLLPWLMLQLTSETSSVDRSGAAQGLSEVVAGLGVEKLHKLMPEIIATAERTDIAPHVKDGYIMMFIYMPGSFTDEFTPYIGQIINPILKALADENEYVRETALRAGQRIVALYAQSAITLLLPELENGLFDENWRIRFSSVQLLGDLLYRISGVSGKMSTETACEDDNFGTEHSHRAIMRALGPERRNRVLAGLYMGRSDVSLLVRQAALHVWKVVVTNTPKTLREIMSTLFGLLLGCLGSTSLDRRQVAARTLGDLVRKLGERVLPEIVPILERGLRSPRADQRQGVCIGLGEIIASTSRDSVLQFADGLVPTVRTALCDPLPEVRQAAARTFDSLHATVGAKALDDVLPHMLERLHDPDPEMAEAALDGLRQVLGLKSRAVLPYLVPQLTAPPANTRALSALAAAAGDALGRHLHRVLPALLGALEAAQGTPTAAQELEYCRGALLPVADDTGVRTVVDSLLDAARAPSEARRGAAAALLCAFVSHTRADLSPYVSQLLRGLILLLAGEERTAVLMAWEALVALTKTLDPEQMIAHVTDVRQAVRFVASDLKTELLHGFCLPKGITPILPLFRESILNGLPEDKENAALMLGEVIRLTSASSLQPSVVHITGPLIRILGDRFNADVKAAVLETLALLLNKVGVLLKQFLPQLQTTFLKALHDPSRPVRIRAGLALAELAIIHTRADPLFVEMHTGVRTADEPAVRDTMLHALRGVITVAGNRLSEPLALSLLSTLTSPALLAHPDDPPRAPVGGCLGALLHTLPSHHLDAALTHHVLSCDTSDQALLHGRSCALQAALKETPAVLMEPARREAVSRALLFYLAHDNAAVVSSGVRAVGYMLLHVTRTGDVPPPAVLAQFARTINHSSNEVKQLFARACAMLGRETDMSCAPPELLRALLPALVNGTKEKNSYVRANAEIALRAMLRLSDGDHTHQHCLSVLDAGAREALSDVVARVLRRGQPADTRLEQLDNTLIT